MIVELGKSDYHLIQPLLKKDTELDSLLIQAVINGTNRGHIYVDDPAQPRTALVYVVGVIDFFIGDPHNDAFTSHLNTFIDNVYKQVNLDTCGGTWMISAVFDEKWEHVLEQAYSQRNYDTDNDLYFQLNVDKFRALNEHTPSLSNEYALTPLTKEIIEQEQNEELFEDFHDFWNSVDDFIAQGSGIAILKDGQAVSTCYTCFVNGSQHEINVITTEEEENQGFATMVSRAYIQHCLNNGIIPRWSTNETNKSSCKVAEKCGFEYVYKLKTYEFEF
ncbi:GNAT family N-acetyltransferase [Paenibacillus sp. SC116]|uniref:GNAT family N-acetyltransferase n=1 Tax=Paenibacillus sp. SC116 TaxID=2968986 RepID=UPI00215B2E5D|nr:GNAT family N-acetyltransferase [Paenibacillus sp. SC116]MCR8844562.1 GNAT family N-acetyltransferase [Paenibacillus sp. SC116]